MKTKTFFRRYIMPGLSMMLAVIIFISQPYINVSAESAEPNSGAFGTVPIPDVLEPGQIEASKEVSDNGDGTYTVTMKVQGEPYSVWDNEADYILLIDTSNSMANYLSNGSTRLEVIRSAALDAVSKITANPDNRVSIITFNRTATVGNQLTNTAVSQSEEELLKYINNNIVPGKLALGTNQQDAFRKARNVMANAADPNRATNVILLTDGLPTVYFKNNTSTDLIGNGAAANVNRATAINCTVNQIIAVKNTYPNLNIYNFGLDITGDSENGEDKMASAISFLMSEKLTNAGEYYWADCVMTSDAAEFETAFSDIIDVLTNTYDAGTAILTDLIDEGFIFEQFISFDGESAACDDGKTVVWDAGTITNAAKTLKFTVRLTAEYNDAPDANNTYYTNTKDPGTVTVERTVREDNPYYPDTTVTTDVPGNFKVVLENVVLEIGFTKDIILGYGVDYNTATFQFGAYRDEACSDLSRLATFTFEQALDGLSKDLTVYLPKSVLGDAYDDLAGTGVVFLKEVAAAGSEWNYDANVYKYSFTRNAEGALEVSDIELVGGSELDESPVFTNTYLPKASLTVSKQVSDTASTNLDFQFVANVLGESSESYDYTKHAMDGTASTGAIQQGDAFTLKADEKIVIEGLAVGSAYNISEDLTGDVYRYYEEENGGIYTGTVADNDITVVNFINHFPFESDISVQLEKAVNPTSIKPGETGDYTIDITNTCEYPLYLTLEDTLYNSMYDSLVSGSLKAELAGEIVYVKENSETDEDDQVTYYLTFYKDAEFVAEFQLEPEEVLTLSYSIVFDAVGEYENTANIVGAYDYTVGDHTDRLYAYDDDDAVILVSEDPAVDVNLEKQVDSAQITAGEYGSYTLLIKNTGDYPLALSVYDDKLDAMFNSVSRLQASYQGKNISVNVSAERLLTFKNSDSGMEFILPVGETLMVTYRILFDTVGTYVNDASVKGVYTREVDGKTFTAIDDDEEEIVVTKTPENPVFTKRPSIRFVSVGDSVDYVIRGFGNDKGEVMDSMSVTDLVPEGIEFQRADIPALRLGEAIRYSVMYKTNLSDYVMLYENIPADKAFSFSAPSFANGERITAITVTFDNAPVGFALGDEMVFTFQVISDPGTGEIINRANMSYTIDDETITIDDEGVPLAPGNGDGLPQTGDGFDWNPSVTAFALSALSLGVFMVVRKKRARK